MAFRRLVAVLLMTAGVLAGAPACAGVLDKAQILARQTTLDNRDEDWYARNIPFLETPERNIDAVYYYRFDMMTKHMVYGSPPSGYLITEFIDRPWWSGVYGAISCAPGLQFSELRWLRDQRVARDYARYWFHTPGAQPRTYSNWFAASMWRLYQAWGDKAFILAMLPDMKAQYEGWEREHYDPKAGLFVWNGMQDGMETNINSRQTADTFRGAEGYRPTLNSYLYADAMAIAQAAALAGDAATAKQYAAKAAALKKAVQEKLWDPKRQFFFHMFANDEKNGVKAGTLTYQTGTYAGNAHGRELIGFVPWQFDLPDPGYETAWKSLMDPADFYSDYGPTTVEQGDPLFMTSKDCCTWSGNSWPYATAQTLEAMANLLDDYQQTAVSKADYLKLLETYAKTQFRDGVPFVAEAADPFRGRWQVVPGHSEHYFHSSYVDLIVTGLAGLRPRADDILEFAPLFPESWAYFALDDIPYRGHLVSIVWDRDGSRYRLGAGLTVLADGQVLIRSPKLARVSAPLSRVAPAAPDTRVNFAVNNDGTPFPRFVAGAGVPQTSGRPLQDGVFWYLQAPANRWTTEGSSNRSDTLELDFGIARPVETLKLYFLDDGEDGRVRPPTEVAVDYWDGAAWRPAVEPLHNPVGRRATVVALSRPIATAKFRFTFVHRPGASTGLSEIEAWGQATLPLAAPTEDTGDLAYNPGDRPYPRATASYVAPDDRVEEVNDGRVLYGLNLPRSRWTTIDSPHVVDWVAIDFGAEKTVGRIGLDFWGDGWGTRAPKGYGAQYWNGTDWTNFETTSVAPAEPTLSTENSLVVKPVKTTKVRIILQHDGQARTALTELTVWEK